MPPWNVRFSTVVSYGDSSLSAQYASINHRSGTIRTFVIVPQRWFPLCTDLGAGLGAGFPGLQFGLGISAGCGIGLDFGYGLGKGFAYDDKKKYSNVGKLFQDAANLPS
ncbi:uncharacterized protein LOC109727683 [Ananas comosus]|uniref:Uncharacterized protein LOC109727683 n=1 Tax=Ananas comosus TaxID=4615 RepID=A0A6P5HDH1_ANACO|nr:uncharacterized protein LOC109727683 [Ananas comosus]